MKVYVQKNLNPISLYGVTKVKAENSYKDVDNHKIFRFATVFGPSSRMRTDIGKQFCLKIFEG